MLMLVLFMSFTKEMPGKISSCVMPDLKCNMQNVVGTNILNCSTVSAVFFSIYVAP